MSLPWPARAYLSVVALAAMGLLAYWLQAWRGPLPADPARLGLAALLVALAAAAQHFPLQLGPHRKVDLSIAVYFASLLLFSTPAAMAVTGVSQLLGQGTLALRRDPTTARRQRPLRTLLFNTSQLIVAAGVAGLVYYSLLPHQAPAPV